MKTLIAILQLLVLGTAYADVGVDVVDIHDPLQPCDCRKPENVGRICIVPTEFAHPELNTPANPLEHPTRFEAKMIEQSRPDLPFLFVFKSTAYYGKCGFDFVIENFSDPYIDQQYKSKKTLWPFAFRGSVPAMRVAPLNKQGQGQYSQELTGTFGEETNLYHEGKFDEFHRIDYPGTTVFETPYYKLLTDTQLRMILHEGTEETRFVKVWLTVHTPGGGGVSFGEYSVKLKFYRKPNQELKNPWDISALGIKIEVQK